MEVRFLVLLARARAARRPRPRGDESESARAARAQDYRARPDTYLTYIHITINHLLFSFTIDYIQCRNIFFS